MSPVPIDFVVQGGREQGLGHVVRSARLAAEAARRGWRVRGFVEGDAAARGVWEETCEQPALSLTESASPFAPIVGLDGPEHKGDLLERLARSGVRPLLIDDERTYDCAPEAPRGWRLLPGLHHAPVETSGATDAAGFALLSGPGFSILPDAHRDLAPTPASERSSVLVSLGGADPHRIAPLVARAAIEAVEALRDHALPHMTMTVDVVFGPCFSDPGEREAERLRDVGCVVHQALEAPQMAARMRAAKLALIGFGTSLTELAWHGTPCLTVTHNDADRGPARDLEARGLARVLGNARRLERVPLATRIKRALLDDHWRAESASAAREAIGDARGIDRLFDRIESDLCLRSGRRVDDRHARQSVATVPPA